MKLLGKILNKKKQPVKAWNLYALNKDGELLVSPDNGNTWKAAQNFNKGEIDAAPTKEWTDSIKHIKERVEARHKAYRIKFAQ